MFPYENIVKRQSIFFFQCLRVLLCYFTVNTSPELKQTDVLQEFMALDQ